MPTYGACAGFGASDVGLGPGSLLTTPRTGGQLAHNLTQQLQARSQHPHYQPLSQHHNQRQHQQLAVPLQPQHHAAQFYGSGPQGAQRQQQHLTGRPPVLPAAGQLGVGLMSQPAHAGLSTPTLTYNDNATTAAAVSPHDGTQPGASALTPLQVALQPLAPLAQDLDVGRCGGDAGGSGGRVCVGPRGNSQQLPFGNLSHPSQQQQQQPHQQMPQYQQYKQQQQQQLQQQLLFGDSGGISPGEVRSGRWYW